MTETILAEIVIPVRRIRFNATNNSEMAVRLVQQTYSSPFGQRSDLKVFHVLDLAFNRVQLINVYEKQADFDRFLQARLFSPGGEPKFWRYEFTDQTAQLLQIWIDSLTLGL